MDKRDKQDKLWSKEEIKFIDKHKDIWSVQSLAERVGRTSNAVSSKLNEIKVNGFDKIYDRAKTEEELKKVKRVFKASTRLKNSEKKQEKVLVVKNNIPNLVKADRKTKKSIRILWGLFNIQW